MDNPIELFIRGVPKPGGSKTPGISKKTGKQYVYDACKGNKAWKNTVAQYAKAHYRGELLDGAILIVAIFYMPRPKSHFNSKGILKPSAPKYHTTRPDATKLFRALEDALTGIVWTDDARIVGQEVKKNYADPVSQVGVLVQISPAS